MKTLEEFRDQFLSSAMCNFHPTEVRNSGDRLSLVAFREPPFQAELIVWGPNFVFPAHRHPHIEIYEKHVSGDLVIVLGKTEAEANNFIARATPWTEKRSRSHNQFIHVLPTDWHGGKTGAKGAVFWSIEKWLKPKISAAGLDWESTTVELTPPLMLKWE